MLTNITRIYRWSAFFAVYVLVPYAIGVMHIELNIFRSEESLYKGIGIGTRISYCQKMWQRDSTETLPVNTSVTSLHLAYRYLDSEGDTTRTWQKTSLSLSELLLSECSDQTWMMWLAILYVCLYACINRESVWHKPTTTDTWYSICMYIPTPSNIGSCY